MNTLVIVFLSILAWQLVVAIVCFASDENETITIWTAIGFWLLPIAFIAEGLKVEAYRKKVNEKWEEWNKE